MRVIGLAVVLAVSLMLAPLVAKAQQMGKVFRVGLISSATPLSETAGPEPANAAARSFVQGLGALGYVEGQNLIPERRSAEGQIERLGSLVAELVRLKADVIVTSTDRMALAAKPVTTTVPIVMASSVDPVRSGIVQSLARPGGNITGLTIQVGPEIEAKRLALLREMLPGISRIAYLASKDFNEWEHPYERSVRTAAQALRVTLVRAEFSPHLYADAFTLISREAEALFVGPSSLAYADRAVIVGFATRTRLPSTFVWRESVELGGLMSYEPNLADISGRASTYVDKILRGAKPADLPVEQPTKFELVINLKTAKTFSDSCQANSLDAVATAAAPSSPGGTARRTGSGVPT
jgi:putative tryptophan/tyrosine transport system substrate-binding protein